MTNLVSLETLVAMSSLELVEFINSQREEGEAELTPANFMNKVSKVLPVGLSFSLMAPMLTLKMVKPTPVTLME
jgi:hypothetical protein